MDKKTRHPERTTLLNSRTGISEQTTLRLTFLGVEQHGNTVHPTSEVDIGKERETHGA